VPDATAIALGLLVYLIFVAASLAGAPSFAFGRTGAIATKDLGET